MPNRNGCIHYWIIEEARGPTSRGVCRKCGKVMMHPNQTELSWEAQRHAARSLFHPEPFAQRATRVKAFRYYA